jgi:predicted TIM-barrel fold metal-dependent hydrolase
MQIVDAQIHLWGSGLPSNLSHRQVTAFTPEEAIALMDEGGVDAAVIHPPGWDPGSTDMAFVAVQNYPGRFAIMGSVPLDRPDSRARIAHWREQPGMLGLRYGFLGDPARRWLHDGPRLAVGRRRTGWRSDRRLGNENSARSRSATPGFA